MLAFLLLLGLTVSPAPAQESWRVVRADGTVEAMAATPRIEPEAAAARRVTSAWTWGANRAPRRLEPSQIGREKLPDDPGRLEVRVIRRAPGRQPEDLRVIAAPGEMWREVPEALLPSWPVPQEGASCRSRWTRPGSGGCGSPQRPKGAGGARSALDRRRSR